MDYKYDGRFYRAYKTAFRNLRIWIIISSIGRCIGNLIESITGTGFNLVWVLIVWILGWFVFDCG